MDYHPVNMTSSKRPQGSFQTRDPWAVANIFWILANGLIQTEEYPERRKLRGRDLETVFGETMDLLIGGLRTGTSLARG